MKLQSKSEADTINIGRRIGEKLERGDVVCLYGELGSGKTTMVKGIASALGISERDVTSASFTIIVEYDTEVPFYHIDLYRIPSGEAPALGLQEYLGTDGIAVVEWAERAEREMPDEKIEVTINYSGENSRDVEIKGIDI